MRRLRVLVAVMAAVLAMSVVLSGLSVRTSLGGAGAGVGKVKAGGKGLKGGKEKDGKKKSNKKKTNKQSEAEREKKIREAKVRRAQQRLAAAKKKYEEYAGQARTAIGNEKLYLAGRLVNKAAAQAEVVKRYTKAVAEIKAAAAKGKDKKAKGKGKRDKKPKDGEGKDEQTDIKSLKEDLDQACEKLLAAADAEYAAGNYKAAMVKYRKITQLTGTRAASEAAGKLVSAHKDPAFQKGMRKADAEAAYAAITRTIESHRKKLASGADDQKDVTSASDAEIVARMPLVKQASILKQLGYITTHYADTDAGKMAAALLKKLQADKALLAAVKTWQARRAARQAYEIAQSYEKSELYDKAAKAYRKLIAAYPDSPYAVQAGLKLARLKGKP